MRQHLQLLPRQRPNFDLATASTILATVCMAVRMRESITDFVMRSQRQQRELVMTRASEMNQHFNSLNGSTTRIVAEPRNQRFIEALSRSAALEERHRLAREIHDTLVQEFAAILLLLEAANGSKEVVNIFEYLARARELAKCGLEDARRMLLGLRPKPLEAANLSDTLTQLAEHFSRECGIRCTFNVSGRAHKLTEEIENELYRVAQEALCNVRKHSRAGSVSISLNYQAAALTLAVRDNGQGFTMKQTQAGANGFGLPAMCDRATRLGGRMDINSRQGTGTELRMSVPLPSKTLKERNHQ